MSRPPKKAIEQIKNYCEKTQCRRCSFGYYNPNENYVYCRLMEDPPCDWDTEEGEQDE